MSLEGGGPGGEGMSTERRLMLAIAMSVLVLMAWNYMFPPPERPTPPQTSPITQPAQQPGQAGSTDPLRATDPTPREADPAPEPVTTEAVGSQVEETITIVTDVFEATFTSRGALSTSWKLREYPAPDGQPLELWPTYTNAQSAPFAVGLLDPSLVATINDALYRVEREELSMDTERLTFTWADGRGIEVRKSFTFRADDYLVDVELDVIDRGRRMPARLALGPGFSAQEYRAGRSNYYYSSTALWHVNGQVAHTKPGKLSEVGGLQGTVRWAGLEDQFFAALILPADQPADVAWTLTELTPTALPEEEEAPKATEVTALAVSIGPEGGQLFVGPKQYKMLESLGSELDEAVWFSSYGWLAWIVKHLYLALLWLETNVAHNFGLAIILATVVLRVVLFPVNQYAMVSMKRSQLQMQKLQPKVKGIKAKYKKAKDAESRQKMNQEMMDLYKREGVNPMGGVTGCLPMFAQFPILIGFYNMLTVAVELRGAPFFGWIQDLSVKDPLFITPLLMGATMFWQQKMAMSRIKDPQQLQQQRMMLFMPIMFTFICLQMPSGLVLYWFVNNLLGMGQQWLVNRHTSRLEPEETVTKKPRRVTAGRKS